jgi:hypothetical protein
MIGESYARNLRSVQTISWSVAGGDFAPVANAAIREAHVAGHAAIRTDREEAVHNVFHEAMPKRAPNGLAPAAWAGVHFIFGIILLHGGILTRSDGQRSFPNGGLRTLAPLHENRRRVRSVGYNTHRYIHSTWTISFASAICRSYLTESF